MKDKENMVIGVFGGMGSGKSLILQILEQDFQAYILETDKIAHELYQVGEEGYIRVLSLLGNQVLDLDKSLNRKKMAKLLFQDATILKKVNQQIHPLVWERIQKKVKQIKEESKQKKWIAIESALLPSLEYMDIFQKKWYIYASLEERYQRLIQTRGYTKEYINRIIKYQPTEQEYRMFADSIIINDGEKEYLYKQIRENL